MLIVLLSLISSRVLNGAELSDDSDDADSAVADVSEDVLSDEPQAVSDAAMSDVARRDVVSFFTIVFFIVSNVLSMLGLFFVFLKGQGTTPHPPFARVADNAKALSHPFGHLPLEGKAPLTH